MTSPTDTVQALYAAFGRGDLDALLALLTDDVEWTFHGSSGLPYMGRFHGKPAVRAWFGHVAEHDGVQRFEPREWLAGADHVTVIGWERTQALPAGAVFDADWIHVWRLRDGRVCRFVGAFDTAASDRARRPLSA